MLGRRGLVLARNHGFAPHRYPIELIDDLYYNTNETINIIDCGSSEAIFEAIISTRYTDMNRFFFILIDPDKYWNEYACKTLDNIGVKYVIINKFLNYDFSLNDLCVSKIHVIKMDIEGAEVKACNAIKDICEKDHPIMMVCTYHNQNDYKEISELLTTYNYEYVYPSKHYMMYMNHDWLFPPYLVRGLCIAHN